MLIFLFLFLCCSHSIPLALTSGDHVPEGGLEVVTTDPSSYSNNFEVPLTPTLVTGLVHSLPSTSSDDSDPDGQPYTGPNCSHLDRCLPIALRGRKVDSERERNCACDQQCHEYGDCCLDSPWINGSTTPTLRPFKCVDIPQLGGFYMVTHCPSNLQNDDLKEKCERGSVESDPLASLPVTDPVARLTYRNIFCAMCRSDVQGKTFWNLNLICTDLPDSKRSPKLTQDEIRSNLAFDVEQNAWMVNVSLPDGSRVIKTCSLNPVFPASVESSIRSCRPGLIESCPIDWEDQSIAQECSSYQASRFTDRSGYRNKACALCNGHNETSLKCSPNINRALGGGTLYNVPGEDINGRSSIPTASLSILLDINGNNGSSLVGQISGQCSEYQIWDLFARSCRSLVCGFKDYRLINGRCINQTESETMVPEVNNEENETDESDSPPTHHHLDLDFHQCPKIELTFDDIEFVRVPELNESSTINDESTIYVSRYNKTFNSTNYLIKGDLILICSNVLQNEISLNKFSDQMGLVTLVGLGISIGSLVLHIIAFALVSDVRNLSGHNLVCLSASLIFAYSSFICMQLLAIRRSALLCRLTGAAVLYFFLASMAWMNVIAWDVCRTLRMATVELRVASGKQRGRFALYSLYAWTISGLFTGAALIADNVPDALIPATLKPGLGLSGHCWFQRRSALIFFFASPVALIMFINLIMFILSTVMIGSTTRGTKSITQMTTARTNYRLYLKLWLLMGLTWLVGFPASFLESLTLWYAFIVLNTLQGLFIFIAFSCKRKIFKTVKSKLTSLTSSSTGGSYSVATLSQNNSKLSESDLNMRTSGHMYYQPHHYHPHHPSSYGHPPPPNQLYLQSNHPHYNQYQRKMSNRH